MPASIIAWLQETNTSELFEEFTLFWTHIIPTQPELENYTEAMLCLRFIAVVWLLRVRHDFEGPVIFLIKTKLQNMYIGKM